MDVAVVGAGITGLSVAWHLTRLGLRPLVLERSGVAAGASGVQPGGVRHQWGTRVNCELALESVAFYRDLEASLGTRDAPRLEACGYLFTADSAAVLERLAGNVALQNGLGIPSRLVTPDEAEQLVPGLLGEGLQGGAWCAEDGYFDRPQGVVEAFAEAVRTAGVELLVAEVAALEPRGAGWCVRLRDGGALAAAQVVMAAGYDAPALLAPLGIALPIEKQRRWLHLSEPLSTRLLEPLVVAAERRFAAKQLASGRVLASDLAADGELDEERDRARRTIRAGVESLLPILELVDYTVLVEGFYDVTPDHQPILGGVAGLPGLWLATGFSGHGFMLAPAVGRRLAAAVAGRDHDGVLDTLALARFADAALVPELQIV